MFGNNLHTRLAELEKSHRLINDVLLQHQVWWQEVLNTDHSEMDSSVLAAKIATKVLEDELYRRMTDEWVEGVLNQVRQEALDKTREVLAAADLEEMARQLLRKEIHRVLGQMLNRLAEHSGTDSAQ